MRRLPIELLQPGMILGRTLSNENGDVLLRGGVKLTQRYIQSIRARGFAAAYVCDGIADDIEPQEIVSEKVRSTARRHMHDMFTLVQRSGAQINSSAEPESKSAFPSVAAPLLAKLSHDVEAIVEEAINAEALDGVITLKSHDNYTFEHSVEVTVAGVLLGKQLHMQIAHLRQLALGCFLHDLGKLFVPPEILNKPGRLTPEEFAIVQQHPQVGYDMVRPLIPAEDAIYARHVVWQHHERQDGTGYPRRLKGNNTLSRNWTQRYTDLDHMLLIAEIAAVADVYSALASDRPYRPAMQPPDIVNCLKGMAGTHLNSEIVERFLSILPVFPVGTHVRVISGEWQGYRGIVVSVNTAAIDRPLVRIIADPYGQETEAFEIDSALDDEIQIVSCEEELPLAV